MNKSSLHFCGVQSVAYLNLPDLQNTDERVLSQRAEEKSWQPLDEVGSAKLLEQQTALFPLLALRVQVMYQFVVTDRPGHGHDCLALVGMLTRSRCTFLAALWYTFLGWDA